MFGFIFTFAEGDGVRSKKVSPHWLFKTTNGEFGQRSTDEEYIGKSFDLIEKF